MEAKIKGLYPKLHSIQCEINGLKKDKKGLNYEYVTGDKLLSFIKPLMNELGLLLKQEIISIENVRQDYITGFGTEKQKQKSEILSKVMQQFTWIDAETGEKDICLWGANGQNDWDKGVGSALTYGERYFLLKFFHISTDQDDIDNRQGEDFGPQETPVQIAIGNARLIMTVEDLEVFWNTQTKEIQSDKQFIATIKARKSQLQKIK